MTDNDRTNLTVTDTNAACSCCAAGATAGTPAATSAVTEEVLVSGMTCSHCVMSVTEELTAIDGVDTVAVDLNAGGASRVTVHSAAPIHADALRTAVEEAGYTLVGSRA